MSAGYTIGKIAKEAKVNIQTLRYYERRGILKPSARKESGYRIYDPSAVRVLRFIKHAQELGFSLDEIQDLLNLRADKKSKCENVQKKAVRQLEEVQMKLDRLERIKDILSELISRCQRRQTDAECPLLECLDECHFKAKEDSCHPVSKKQR